MNKYVRAVSTNYIYFFFNTLFFFLITSIAIHVMGEEFYGLWSILNAILVFSSVGMLGMGMVVNKFSSEIGENAIKPELILTAGFTIILPMASLIALILLISRDWIALQLGLVEGLQRQFSQAVIFTAASIFPQFLARVPQGYLLSQLKNELVRAIELVQNITLWVGVVVIAFLTKNLIWMALWGLLVNVVGLFVLLLVIKSLVNLKWRADVETVRRMLNFSFFSFIESVAITLFQQFDRILIGFTLGPIAAGAYSVGTSIGLRLPIINGQATEVMVSYASRKDNLGSHTALYATFRKLSQFSSLLTGLLTALLILWMDVILRLWISPLYAEAYSSVFRLLALAYFFVSLSRSGHQTLTGIGKVGVTSLIYLISSLLMLIGVYLFSTRMGLIGAALANLLMVFLLSFNLLVYRNFTGHLPWRVIASDLGPGVLLPCFGYAVIMLSSSFLYTSLRFMMTFAVIIFVVVYALKNDWIRTWLRLPL